MPALFGIQVERAERVQPGTEFRVEQIVSGMTWHGSVDNMPAAGSDDLASMPDWNVPLFGDPNTVPTIVRQFAVIICAGVMLTMNPLAQAGWFSGRPPEGLGVRDGRLKPCPETPNCVNSQDQGSAAVPPIAYRGSANLAWQRLATIIETMPRTTVTHKSSHYLRAEAASRLLGFLDDVEFLLDDNASVIHVRSASRLGYSDLGVNRRRIEQVRTLFAAESTAAK